ncbi:hypothetical protein [Fundicoccus culcitae]|uniref:Uncharacterized protein n=1 Tax=Fundicoccus culcitae TaxID=2969821 RepID=A0ABY5P9A0_9LACT|nr:hypothetical protein [Fundicoccus culcitae]UUX35334.1 hypothetical protein NRE15_06730 [Fundicoccus culcitae]
MKSSVEYYPDYETIALPDQYLTIEIPSWDAVAQPTLETVLEQYKSIAHVNTDVLTDDMVAALEIPNINSVSQLTQYAIDYFQKNSRQRKFYNEILPFLMAYYAEAAEVVINSEEKEAYFDQYYDQLNQFAEEEEMDLETYGAQILNLAEPVMQGIEERAEEDFIFHLIARKRYDEQGLKLDEEAYENFIHQNVLHQHADEIEIRDRLPYVKFKQMMPEMLFTQNLYDFFTEKIRFVKQGEA